MFRVFLIIFVFSLAEEGSGFDTKVSHFQIFRKHPNLKKCVSTILQKNWQKGVSGSEKTGRCHILLRNPWGSFERGKAYAWKVFVEETFQPPVDGCKWDLPGILNTGARLDMFILIKRPEELGFVIDLIGASADRIRRSFNFEKGMVSYYEIVNWENVVEMPNYTEFPAQFTSRGVVKVSFLVRSASVAMLVEDEVLFTGGDDDIYSTAELSIFSKWQQVGQMGIHRIVFTAAP